MIRHIAAKISAAALRTGANDTPETAIARIEEHNRHTLSDDERAEFITGWHIGRARFALNDLVWLSDHTSDIEALANDALALAYKWGEGLPDSSKCGGAK